MLCGYISASRSGCAWWRSCWRPAASSSATKPSDNGRARYTAFTETAEPEEVLDFLREYHGELGPLVSQFEGTLDQFSGDGIMVFFQ